MFQLIKAADMHPGATIHTNEAPPCPVDGCVNTRGRRMLGRRIYYARMCWGHMTREVKHGDPTVGGPLKPKTGTPCEHGNGYLSVIRADHPLATKSGRVFLHRVVLFQKIGPGEHPCHHCGQLVSWDEPQPYGLVVDHLDHDRANNDADNLVPACRSCNARRQMRKKSA